MPIGIVLVFNSDRIGPQPALTYRHCQNSTAFIDYIVTLVTNAVVSTDKIILGGKILKRWDMSRVYLTITVRLVG